MTATARAISYEENAMVIRIYGYLVRCFFRFRSAWKGFAWLWRCLDDPKCTLTDWGRMDSMQFCISEPWWALTHFMSKECAESWIRYFREFKASK